LGRLKLNDTVRDVLLKLADGNPGAMNVIAQLLAKEDGLLHVLKLDDLEIYDSLIWLCYKDLLGSDIDKLYNLLKTNKLEEAIKETIETDANFKRVWEYHVARIRR